MSTFKQSYRTAKNRNSVSAPMKFLSTRGLLVGEMLDYGCGKGFDADHFGMDKFDPHYTDGAIVSSDMLTPKLYDTITCNYVLNVIEDKAEQAGVLDKIKALLAVGGKAYITVRRDVKHPVITRHGTYQEDVILDLPIVKQVTTKYCIYLLTNDK